MTDKRWDTHVTWWREPESEDITFTGRVNMRDLARLRLDHVERAALRTAPATAADFLLDLEIIFRRLGEQREARIDHPLETATENR